MNVQFTAFYFAFHKILNFVANVTEQWNFT
jgi:hypothetical protein